MLTAAAALWLYPGNEAISIIPERDKDCRGCDLTDAILMDANLTGAKLNGVIGADFSVSMNVPPSIGSEPTVSAPDTDRETAVTRGFKA